MEEEDLLGSLEFSDDEDYVISLNELHNQAELDSDDDVHVPLLEVSPSTGSLQSLAFSDSMVNESFRKYHPDKKCTSFSLFVYLLWSLFSFFFNRDI